MRACSKTVAALLLALCALAPPVLAADSASSARAALDEKFAADLESLAAKCDELEMAEQAAQTRAWRLRPAPGKRRMFLPQESAIAAADSTPAVEPNKNVANWNRKFLSLRRDFAAKLVSLGRDAIEQGDLALGYGWLHEALREDPDQPIARQALDYRIVNGRWRRAGAATRVEPVRVRHPHFDFTAGKYWRVESAHFRITTDDSPEAGQELAAILEEFYDVWRQTFVEFWTTGDAILSRMDRPAPLGRSRKRFRVTLFRDRAAYVSNLKPQQPLIDKTVGIYFDKQEESYFYSGDGDLRPNWHHETTHQLFQEAVNHPPGPGADANFWALEGAALYMESLAREGDGVTLGGYDADRMQFARYRALSEKFYVPIEDFVAIGKDAAQKDPNLPKLYSQAAGLSHYLIDGDGGRHRGRFVRYLKAIYEQRAEADAMPQIWGDDFSALDAGYAAFLDVRDDDLLAAPPAASIRNLCLGRTSVTDRGLSSLAKCNSLEWLDLSDTAVGDAGLKEVSQRTSLKRLWLSNTNLTSDGLAPLAALPELEELHLEGVSVDRAVVEGLQRALPKLEIVR